MVDIRFQYASNSKWTPATAQLARDFTAHIIDVTEAHTSNDACPIEGAIAGLYAAYVHHCNEAGYDPIGVAELLLTRDDANSGRV